MDAMPCDSPYVHRFNTFRRRHFQTLQRALAYRGADCQDGSDEIEKIELGIAAWLCEVLCINERKVASARRSMKSGSTLHKLAATFKVLGDPTRTKIISALLQEELCVCDLASL